MSALPESRTGSTDPGPPALFRRFPELRERIPWVSLGRFPTPVERLPVERIELEHARDRLWVKRDDLTGEPYGGNKVRKLEWVLAEARRQGATRLITAGAFGSHHALATTVYGKQLGFEVSLVLFPQSMTPHVREVLLLDHALGAELRFTRRMEMIPGAVLAARVAHRKEKCFVVAPGGSDPVGTLGYVSAALEFAEQIEVGEAPRPDVVHVATGTMGTAGGLALGFALANLPIHIAATRITAKVVTNDWTLRRLIRSTARLLEKSGLSIPPLEEVMQKIELRHRQLGLGYGKGTEPGRHATELLNKAGLVLDPTYTAKAAAELLDSIEEDRGGTHLFWHTLSAAEPALAEEANPSLLPESFRRYLP